MADTPNQMRAEALLKMREALVLLDTINEHHAAVLLCEAIEILKPALHGEPANNP